MPRLLVRPLVIILRRSWTERNALTLTALQNQRQPIKVVGKRYCQFWISAVRFNGPLGSFVKRDTVGLFFLVRCVFSLILFIHFFFSPKRTTKHKELSFSMFYFHWYVSSISLYFRPFLSLDARVMLVLWARHTLLKVNSSLQTQRTIFFFIYLFRIFQPLFSMTMLSIQT